MFAPGFECEGRLLVGITPHARHSSHAVVVAKTKVTDPDGVGPDPTFFLSI